MDKQQFECFTLSPLDGRYAGIKDALGEYFSEYALVKYRVFVEIQWLKFLIENVESDVLSTFDKDNLGQIEAISKDFNYDSFKAIKDIEAVTRHDVKAVEYFIGNQLKDMGYSDNDIKQLRVSLSKKNINEDEIIKEIRGATLNLVLGSAIASKSKYTFNYSFRWSSCPIFIQDDLLAATWSATGSNGSPVNVAINKSSSFLTVKYKSTGGAPNMKDTTYKWNPIHEYRAAKIQFDMGYNMGSGMSYWTYYGSGKLVLDAVVSNTIYEVYLKFGYGHSVVTGTPSVSFSGSGPSIGMSFGWTTQNEETYSVRYRYDGHKVS